MFPQLPCAQEQMGMQCGRVSTLQNSVGEDSPEADMWWGVRTPHDHHLEHSDIQTDIMGDLPMKTHRPIRTVSNSFSNFADGSSRFPPGSSLLLLYVGPQDSGALDQVLGQVRPDLKDKTIWPLASSAQVGSRDQDMLDDDLYPQL